MRVSSQSLAVLLAGVALAGSGLALRYRASLKPLRRVLTAGSRVAWPPAGPIEYGIRGAGPAMLVVHGAGGGYDQGLLIARDFTDYRVVAPSRFGYLRTPLPADASAGAQAAAHAALLDALHINRAIVVAASAGVPSAIELALRYPHRVRALVLLVPRGYPVGAADFSGFWNRLILSLVMRGAGFGYWSLLWRAPQRLLCFMGVPPALLAQASEAELKRVAAIMFAGLPLRPRAPGLRQDAIALHQRLPLERIAAPALVITARDDLFDTLPAAKFMAEHMPRAELLVLEEGGHLFLGRYRVVVEAVAAFLSRLPPG